MKKKMRFISGDEVVVTAGCEKGARGKVLKVYLRESKITVQGVNLRNKRVKNRAEGAIRVMKIEAPFDASNAMHVDPMSGVKTKIGYKVVEGKKFRYAKKSGELINAIKASA